MGFEITISRNLPLTSMQDLDEAARIFLSQIGYLRNEGESAVAMKVFKECFLKRPDKVWTAEEMSRLVGASKPTVYRYIGRLRDIDIIEEAGAETRKGLRRGYRLRYGSLSKAWNFVEANVEVAMENYRGSVEHLEALAEKERRK